MSDSVTDAIPRGMAPEDALRVRLIVDNVLVHEAWIDVSKADANKRIEELAFLHTQIIPSPDALYCIEFYDPAGPPDGRFRRMGTDPRSMVAPTGPMTFDQAKLVLQHLGDEGPVH